MHHSHKLFYAVSKSLLKFVQVCLPTITGNDFNNDNTINNLFFFLKKNIF